MKLNEFVKNYRDENKLSQREFARRCDLSHSLISLIEKGKNPQTGKVMAQDMETYKKLADGMQISVQKLFEKIDDEAAVKLKPEVKEFKPRRLYATDALPRGLGKTYQLPVYGRSETKTTIAGERMIPAGKPIHVVSVEEEPELRALLKMWKFATPERKKDIVRIFKTMTDE